MITRAQKVRLGVFVLTAGVLLVGSLAVLAGLQIARDYDRYTVRYSDSVSGLEVGAAVKYHGLRVGKVEQMRIDPTDPRRVEVSLALTQDTPISAAVRAELGSVGITGLKYIELSEAAGPADSSARRSPGSEIPAGTSFIDRITGKAEDVARRADLLLQSLTDMLDDATRARFQSLVANLDDLAAQARDAVTENRENLREGLAGLRDAIGSAQIVLDAVSDGIEGVMADIRGAVSNLAGLLDRDQLADLVRHVDQAVLTLQGKIKDADVKGALAAVRNMSQRAGQVLDNVDLTVVKGREGLFASLDYLVEGLENFAEFARSVRENPSVLLRGPQEEDRPLP